MNEQHPLIQTLCDLIRIPSCSHEAGGEEEEIQAFVEARMREAGTRVRTFTAADVPGFLQHPLTCGPERNYRNRPTVIGEIGPADAPALLVLAHSDTVSINNEPERWKVAKPFQPVVRDGRLYGRGSGDDKWGVACLIHLLETFAPDTRKFRKRLICASTIDEENGVGNGLLLLHLAGIKAEKALYLDGCNEVAVTGNLGGSNLYIRPKMRIETTAIRELEIKLRDTCDLISQARSALFEQPGFEGSHVRGSSVAVRAETATESPFLMVYFYTLPGEDGPALLHQLEEMVRAELGSRAADFEFSSRTPWFEPTNLPQDHPWVAEFGASFKKVAGRLPEVSVGSKQDSFVLRKYADIPTLSFGVSRSSGPGALHTADEFIFLEDAAFGWRVARQAVADWLEVEP